MSRNDDEISAVIEDYYIYRYILFFQDVIDIQNDSSVFILLSYTQSRKSAGYFTSRIPVKGRPDFKKTGHEANFLACSV